MSETKHTPGEWFFELGPDGAFVVLGGEKGNKIIALTIYATPEDEANAAMFVAAPDMLAALKAIQKIAGTANDSDEFFRVVKIAQAAIAKAGGQ